MARSAHTAAAAAKLRAAPLVIRGERSTAAAHHREVMALGGEE